MAVGDAYVFPGFLTLVLTQLSFQSHRLLFSYASEVRGKIMLKRKFASTGYRTHNHQVMSQSRAPLSQPGEASNLVDLPKLKAAANCKWIVSEMKGFIIQRLEKQYGKMERILVTNIFLISLNC